MRFTVTADTDIGIAKEQIKTACYSSMVLILVEKC